MGRAGHLPLRPHARPASEVYSIDTPPPTVSGSLHVGHVFSLHPHRPASPATSACAGSEVFYPMGWDDNGLPTERRVQNYYGVRCDPSLPYDPVFEPPGRARARSQLPISRRNFVELCERLDRRGREGLRGAVAPARPLGRLVARPTRPSTSASRARLAARVPAQPGPRRGLPGRRPRPCGTSTFRTAVAQAELEDRERAGRLPPDRPSTGPDGAACTSRRPGPSCSPACVALVAHPDDERYQPLFGSTVRTPLFGVEVPVVAHHLADPDKGTGIAMICTFGDLTDVTGGASWSCRPGRSSAATVGCCPRRPSGWPPAAAATAYAELAGKTTFSAQRAHRRAARATAGDLDGEPATDHAPGEVLREGRQAARDRHHAASGTSATAAGTTTLRGALRGAGRRDHVAPDVHAGTATRTGSTASTATG